MVGSPHLHIIRIYKYRFQSGGKEIEKVVVVQKVITFKGS